MKIQIDPHTLQRARERGTNAKEVRDVIATGFVIPAKYGRRGKAKVYDFKQERNGKYYEQKRVEVIYVIEGKCDNNGDRLRFFTENGREAMQVSYNSKTDLLYIRLDDRKQKVINRRLNDDVVLDIGRNDRIVGIEILDTSKHLNLEKLLPVQYAFSPEAA